MIIYMSDILCVTKRSLCKEDFLVRIEKIAKITGVDFDNANEVLAFRIGLVVYKMIEKYNKDYL